MTPFCWDFCELVNLIMTVLTSCWSTTTQSEPAMRMWLVTYLTTLWNKSITAVVLLFCHTKTVRAEESCTLILVCFATSFDHMQCAKGACGVVESVVCLCVNCVKLWMDFGDIFWGQQLLWHPRHDWFWEWYTNPGPEYGSIQMTRSQSRHLYCLRWNCMLDTFLDKTNVINYRKCSGTSDNFQENLQHAGCFAIRLGVVCPLPSVLSA